MNYEKSMMNRTYGFDLTPLLLMAWQTKDQQWLETLNKRYQLDRELFPEFYHKNKPKPKKGRL